MPATLSLVAISLLVVWMGVERGGYFIVGWTLPALALAALILAGIALGVIRGPGSRVGVVAILLFGGYAVWTFASILWAPNRGDAWLGASLTLLYVLVVWVTASLVNAGASRRWVLSASAPGPAGVAAVTVLSLEDRLESLFENGRLMGTVGYYNGEAAFLLAPFWVSMYLAGSRRVNPLLRGAVLAGAVLSVETAVLTQSRGAMVAMAASTPVFFLLSGQRLRGLLALAPVAVALLVAFPGLNEVYQSLSGESDASAAISNITPVVWLSTAAAGVYGLLWGMVDGRWRPTEKMARAAGVAALAGVLIVAVAGTFALTERVGSPVTFTQQKWEDFKTNDATGEDQSRYLSASGQGRYSLWRIAWQDFVSRPVTGIGAHNYEATYYQLREQTTTGSVRQPHMLALEVLAERGVVGGALFFGFLATCAATGLRERFGRLTSEGKAQVGALLAAAAYWFVHSSAEWFWQIPAVTLPAMIYLGMLITPWRRRSFSPLGWPLRAAGMGAAALAIAAVAPLYISDRYLAQTYETANPAEAMVFAERAQRFDPLSHLMQRREGELAIQLGNLDRAEAALEEAIRLNPEHYAPYALSASFYEQRDRPVEALEMYQKALALNPLSSDLNRQAIQLLPRATGETATVRLVDGGAQASLRLEIEEGSAGGGPLQPLSIPSGADGVLIAWPENIREPFPAQSAENLSAAFVNTEGEVVSISPLSGQGAIEPPDGYSMAVVAERGFFEENGIGADGNLILAASPTD